MALQKQVIPIVLDKGIQQKIDEKVLPAGQLAVLNNAVIRKVGRLTKRPGTDFLPNTTTSGVSLGSANGIVEYNDELLQFAKNSVYSYSPATQTWFNKGKAPLSTFELQTVIRNNDQQQTPDSVFNSGVIISAWEDSSGGVRVRAVDETSNTVFVDNELVDVAAIRPKLVSFGAFSYLYYVVSGNLYVRKFDKSSVTPLGAPVSIASTLNASGLYDVCLYGTNMVVVWHNVAAQITIAFVTPDPVLGGTLLGLPNPANLPYAVTDCLTVWPVFNQQYVAIGLFDSGTGTRLLGIAAVDFSIWVAPILIDAVSSPVTRNITGIYDATNNVNYVFYEVEGVTADVRIVKASKRDIDLVSIVSPFVLSRACGLSSKAFLTSAGQAYVLISHESALQSTYFLCDFDGQISVRSLYQTAGGNTLRQGHLPEASTVSVDIFNICGLVKNRIVTENTTTYSRTGVIRFKVDLTEDVSPQTAVLGENLHLFSAYPQIYDGVSFVEMGFNQYPERISHTTSSTGGNMSDGTYSYVITYEWTDAKGQLHRSATSLPYEVTLSHGTSTQYIELTLPTYRITSRKGGRNQPLIVVYRSTNNGQINYRVSSSISPALQNGLIFSDASVDTVTFQDALSDSVIQTAQAVYTTGGILDNFPPPPCTVGVVYRNRIVTNSSEQGGVSVYSKEFSTKEAIAFTEGFEIKADPEESAITAFGIIDGKLLMATGLAWFGTAGQGPNDAGQFNDFAVPEQLTVSVGCPYPNSVISTFDGIVFKSLRGFYKLRRDLTEEYIGHVVEDFNNLTVSAALQMPGETELRFFHSDGECLVYNFFFNQWSTFTNYAVKGAILWKNTQTMVQSNGRVRVETPDVFLDAGSPYSMTVEFGWISLSPLQGLQRIYRLLVLGQYVSSHRLKILVAKDFEPAWAETIYFDPLTAVNQSTYGQQTYGLPTPYGGTEDSVYQARIHLKTQKCQAIKFRIQDVQGSGEGLSLNAISLEAGLLFTAFKSAISKGAGSSTS